MARPSRPTSLEKWLVRCARFDNPLVLGLATIAILTQTSFALAAGPSGADEKVMGQLRAGQVRFAEQFYTASGSKDRRRNMAVSPYSAFESLAMLQLGARGITQKAISNAAGISPSSARQAEAFRTFRGLGETTNYFFPAFFAANQGYGVKLLEDPFQGSPAAASGLAKGDLIFSVDSLPIRNEMEMMARCRQSDGVVEVSGFDFSRGVIIPKLRVTLNKAPAQGPSAETPLLTAAALWLDRGVASRSQYSQLLKKQFGADVFPIQFADSRSIADEASRYFAGRTANRISRVQPVELGQQARFLLIQASALDAHWKRPFPVKATQVDKFTTPEGIVRTPYMRMKRPILYAQMPGYQVIELPLNGGNLAMRFFLPAEPGGWLAIESKWLTVDEQHRLAATLKKQQVDIWLPRFRVETNESLKDAMTKIGLGNLFSNEADFAGISNDRNLKLADMQQQTYVEIDEQGVRAGAITQSVGILKGVEAPNPAIFHAKHPFLFQIVDASGPTFFAGRVTNPELAR